MSDIFLSYASEDRDKARQIADALFSQGWSVWWDRTIPAGKEFDDVIQEAINQSRCVVVLWSKQSINSRWVKTEAGEGADRNILVPSLIEDVSIPFAFKRIQAADLIQWDGEVSSADFTKFIADISMILGSPPNSVPSFPPSIEMGLKSDSLNIKLATIDSLGYISKSEDELAVLAKQKLEELSQVKFPRISERAYEALQRAILSKVTKVLDGSILEIELEREGGRIKETGLVRMRGVKVSQIHGKEKIQGMLVKNYLTDLVLDKFIAVTLYGVDHYSRYVADIYYLPNCIELDEILSKGQRLDQKLIKENFATKSSEDRDFGWERAIKA